MEAGSGSRYESGEGSMEKVRRRKAVVLIYGILESSEHLKQRRDLGGFQQHKRSYLGWQGSG